MEPAKIVHIVHLAQDCENVGWTLHFYWSTVR